MRARATVGTSLKEAIMNKTTIHNACFHAHQQAA
jgi:hypothetical protein